MKPLIVLARIILVGCLWSIIFTEGVRVIILENWYFDIFWPLHWIYAWNLWQSGWIIDTPKEWAFILIIISFIPLWLTGWIAISMIAWEKLLYKTIMLPVNFIRGNTSSLKPNIVKTPIIVKKKSYKEIRPTGHRSPIRDYTEGDKDLAKAPAPVIQKSITQNKEFSSSSAANVSVKEKAVTARETFSHSLFNLDNEDDDFDLDFESFDKSDIFKIDEKKSNKKDDRKSFKENSSNDDEDMLRDSLEAKKRRKYDDHYSASRKYDEEYEDDEDFARREDKKDRNVRNDDRSSFRRSDDVRDRRENKKYSQSEKIFVRNDKKSKERSQYTEKNRSNNPIVDVLNQKGYDIITGVTIKNTIIDFLAVSENQICLCLVDKETGDWLADEERFNNEEPLWFSENSHRISPVRKASLAAKALSSRLDGSDFDIEVKPYVIIQMGNIINAEDMFEVWEETNVEVTRINRGSPKEIKLFSKTVEEAESKLSDNELNALKKMLRNGI